MSKKKSSGKALPILTIVFSGVGLLFFAMKFAVGVTKSILVENSTTGQAIGLDLMKTLPMSFAAIIFILYAAAYLRRSPNAGKWLTAVLAGEIASCVLTIVRLYYINSTATVYYSLFGLIAVLCAVALILKAKKKSIVALLAVASAAGIAIGVIQFAMVILNIMEYYGYFFDHYFILASTFFSSFFLAMALIFYFIAFMFTGMYKKVGKPEPVKVVIKK